MKCTHIELVHSYELTFYWFINWMLLKFESGCVHGGGTGREHKYNTNTNWEAGVSTQKRFFFCFFLHCSIFWALSLEEIYMCFRYDVHDISPFVPFVKTTAATYLVLSNKNPPTGATRCCSLWTGPPVSLQCNMSDYLETPNDQRLAPTQLCKSLSANVGKGDETASLFSRLNCMKYRDLKTMSWEMN